jgi:hypothetical protein
MNEDDFMSQMGSDANRESEAKVGSITEDNQGKNMQSKVLGDIPTATPTQVPNQSGIIIKEMFCYTKLKIYPDGSVFMEIKGRPKDFEQKVKPNAPPRQMRKVVKKSKESY